MLGSMSQMCTFLPFVSWSTEVIKNNIVSYNEILDHDIVGVNASRQKLKPNASRNRIIIVVVFVVLLMLIIFTITRFYYR